MQSSSCSNGLNNGANKRTHLLSSFFLQRYFVNSAKSIRRGRRPRLALTFTGRSISALPAESLDSSGLLIIRSPEIADHNQLRKSSRNQLADQCSARNHLPTGLKSLAPEFGSRDSARTQHAFPGNGARIQEQL